MIDHAVPTTPLILEVFPLNGRLPTFAPNLHHVRAKLVLLTDAGKATLRTLRARLDGVEDQRSPA